MFAAIVRAAVLSLALAIVAALVIAAQAPPLLDQPPPPPSDGSGWYLALYALLFVAREITHHLERIEQRRASIAAAEQATRVALARIQRGLPSDEPPPGGIMPT